MQRRNHDADPLHIGMCMGDVTGDDLSATFVGLTSEGDVELKLIYEDKDGNRYHIALDKKVSGALFNALCQYCQTLASGGAATDEDPFEGVEVPDSWPE